MGVDVMQEAILIIIAIFAAIGCAVNFYEWRKAVRMETYRETQSWYEVDE